MTPKHLKTAAVALAAFLAISLGVAVVIAVNAVGGIRDIEKASEELELRNFRVAGQLRSQVFRLSANSVTYQVTGDEVYRERGTTYIEELHKYLDDVRPLFDVQEEKAVFSMMESRISQYEEELEPLVGNDRPSDPKLLAAHGRAAEVRDQIIELTSQLGESRRSVFKNSLETYNDVIRTFQYSLVIALGFLVTSLAFLAGLAYRAYVHPLQEQLADAEEVVEEKQELATIGSLAAGIAHEIRNPITAMKARMFALREFISTDSPAEHQAAVIDSELDRLERIVTQVLDFARPMEPDRKVVSSAEMLDGFHEALLPEIEARGISFDMGETAEADVSVDSSQLQQVMRNLVRNAAEACGIQGGTISLSSTVDAGTLTIRVSDTGVGIPPEYQARVFEPFFSKKKGGTGLGLPISRNLVRSVGGDLTLVCTPAGGTAFEITLPVLAST